MKRSTNELDFFATKRDQHSSEIMTAITKERETDAGEESSKKDVGQEDIWKRGGARKDNDGTDPDNWDRSGTY